MLRYLAAAAALMVLAACGVPGPASPTHQLVLADSQPVGQYNPAAGYGAAGLSPLYDGLLMPAAAGDEQLPQLVPNLAADGPQVSDNSTTWTVHLRPGVLFSDGTTLDSGDVAATYRNVIDPATGSPIAADFTIIDRIDTPDPHTVVFHLSEPVAGFSSRLLLGIAPEERIQSGPATASPLNTDPVGTGPYRLEHLAGDEATFVTNPHYRGNKPAISRIIVRSTSDDTSRANQVLSGQIDGTVVPARLADSLAATADIDLTVVHTADWRGISLPASNPATADPVMRVAMNAAVDRQAIIDHVLGGHGTPATTPFAPAYQLRIPPFPPRSDAAQALRAAGWQRDGGGVWRKDAIEARVTLAYPADDMVRRELASAFADQMRQFGVEVTLWGASWDDIENRRGDVAIMLGGGDNPYTLDTQAYRVLHTPGPATGVFDNPGGYSDPILDDALETARAASTTDTTAWEPVVDAYMANPGYVFVTFLDHTYLSAPLSDYQRPAPIMEPHSHGVTLGPWSTLAAWQVRQ